MSYLKIRSKRKSARKIFLFASMWLEVHWIFFPCKKKKVSISDWKRALTHHTETFYANQAINKISGWKRIRHSKLAAFFLYQMGRWWLNCSTRMLNPQLLHCECSAQIKDWGLKKSHFNEWDTQFSTVFWKKRGDWRIFHAVADQP